MGRFQEPAQFVTAQRTGMLLFWVGQVYGVRLEELRARTRGRPHVARTRQIAIHLARSLYGMSHNQLAEEFRRDRSTIHHACHLIAAQREQDAAFDASLCRMEAMVRQATGMAA